MVGVYACLAELVSVVADGFLFGFSSRIFSVVIFCAIILFVYSEHVNLKLFFILSVGVIVTSVCIDVRFVFILCWS